MPLCPIPPDSTSLLSLYMPAKTTLILLAILCVNIPLFSQNALFGTNLIGVVYVTEETPETYRLKIAFHIRQLPNYKVVDFNAVPFKNVIDTIDYVGDAMYFDQKGSFLRRKQTLKFQITFWCDNDGGTQFRPEAEVVIRKKDLARPLTPDPENKKIAAFIIINRDYEIPIEPDFSVSKDVRLTGDYNNDQKPDCFIWTYHDDAENCDNKPLNHLGIALQLGKNHFPFRCCGP